MNEEMIKKVLSAIVDCFVNALSSLNLIQGKKTRYVFFVCLGLTGIAIILKLLHLYAFVSIPECLIATGFAGIMVLMGYKNTKALNDIKLKFQRGGKHER